MIFTIVVLLRIINQRPDPIFLFQLVSHTPVKALGLNFIGHFKLDSQEQQHKVGDTFAPKGIWNKLYPNTYAGLDQLTTRIQQGTRDDTIEKPVNEKRITVQPCHSFKYGVSLSINDHHNVSIDNDLTPAEQVSTIIDEKWQSSWEDSVRVFDQVLSSTGV